MLSLASGSGQNTNIRQSMLELPTHSGFHDLFLNYILVNKRNYTKIFFNMFFYVKTKTIVYYHLRQCLRETSLHKTNNNILFRYGKIHESQFSVP